MRNADQWVPSKFVYRKGRLRGSRDPKELTIASRVIADLVAGFYNDALPKYAKGRLVDLGCGKVPLYATYKDHITENICVDWANSMHPNPYLDQEQDLNVPLALPDATFDTIILSDVLEHIRKPEELLNEMFRVLRPEGHVLMNVPFYYGLHEQPFDYFRYTRFALQSMTEDAGYTVVSLESIGGVPEIISDLISKSVKPLGPVGRFSAGVIQDVTGWFIRTWLGRKLSARTSGAYPYGYVLVLRKG